MDRLSELSTTFTLFSVILGELGFIMLLATRDWKRERFMRALMYFNIMFSCWVSLGIVRFLVTGEVRSAHGYPDWLIWYGIVFNSVINFGVWYQFASLFIEIKKGFYYARKQLEGE